MKPSEIISLARRQTGCTEDIVTTDEAFRFLNFVIEDFWADIRSSDAWFWFDIVNLTTTAWVSKYNWQNTNWSVSNKFKLSKIDRVWYQLEDWKWRDLPIHFVEKMDINSIPNDWEPRLCFMTNSDITLVPEPKRTANLQIWGYDFNRELTKASADDLEANIWIPARWHYILVEWMKYWMYGNMWVNFEWARTNARNFYDSEKMKAIQNIVDRWQEADESDYPFLNFLNY